MNWNISKEELDKLFNAPPDYDLGKGEKAIRQQLNNKEYEDAKKEYEDAKKQYQDAKNQENALSQQNNLTLKYVFNQDYEATTKVEKQKAVGDYTENIEYITLKYKFKKGDIFDGKKIPVNAGANPEAKKYNIQITTPKSIKFDGSDYVGQVTYQIDDSLVSEATTLQKHKNHLLILGALVLGYLAYKKLNK